jgi:hypothetical protein
MATFRTDKTARPFTRIDNEVLDNPDLSDRAKLVLIQMLRKPDHWEFYSSELERTLSCKRDALLKALRELEVHGFIRRIPSKSDSGRFARTTWMVYESPSLRADSVNFIPPQTDSPTVAVNKVSPQTVFPTTVNPDTVEPETENTFTDELPDPLPHSSKNDDILVNKVSPQTVFPTRVKPSLVTTNISKKENVAHARTRVSDTGENTELRSEACASEDSKDFPLGLSVREQFNWLIDELRAESKGNRRAYLLHAAQVAWYGGNPEMEGKEYSRIHGLAKRMGGISILAKWLYKNIGSEPLGDPLAYAQKSWENEKKRMSQDDRKREEPSHAANRFKKLGEQEH